MATIYEEPISLQVVDDNGVLWFLQQNYVDSPLSRGFHLRKSTDNGATYSTVYSTSIGAVQNSRFYALYIDTATNICYCSAVFDDNVWRLWEIDITTGLEALIEHYSEAQDSDSQIYYSEGLDSFFKDSNGDISVCYSSFYTSMGDKWQCLAMLRRGVDWATGTQVLIDTQEYDSSLLLGWQITSDTVFLQNTEYDYHYFNLTTQTVISTGVTDWRFSKGTARKRSDILYGIWANLSTQIVEVIMTEADLIAGNAINYGVQITDALHPQALVDSGDYAVNAFTPIQIQWATELTKYVVLVFGTTSTTDDRTVDFITYFVDHSGVITDISTELLAVFTRINITSYSEIRGGLLEYDGTAETIDASGMLSTAYNDGVDIQKYTITDTLHRVIVFPLATISADLILPMLTALGYIHVYSFNIISALQFSHELKANLLSPQGRTYLMYVDGVAIPIKYFTLRKYIAVDGNPHTSVSITFPDYYFSYLTEKYGTELKIVLAYSGIELDLFIGLVTDVTNVSGNSIIKSESALLLHRSKTIISTNEMYYRIVSGVKTFRSEPNYNVTINDLFIAGNVQQTVNSVTIFESLGNRFMEVS